MLSYSETILNFRVLKDFKGKAAVHVEWVKAWGQCLAELQVHDDSGGDDGGDDGDDGEDDGDDNGEDNVN